MDDQPSREVLQLGRLPTLWRLVDEGLKRYDRLPESHSMAGLTARRFDEAKPAGHRPYYCASRYVSVARDNHRALMTLLQSEAGLGPFAPWSLLRPMFEASFLTLWILEPDRGDERRGRGLRCEIVDLNERRKHTAVFENVPKLRRAVRQAQQRQKDGSEAVYRTEAETLGLKWESLQNAVDVAGQVARLRHVRATNDPMMAALYTSCWRTLSGYEHGFGWAALHGSDKTVVADIPGGVSMELRISDDAFNTVAGATYLLMIEALNMFVRRHTRI